MDGTDPTIAGARVADLDELTGLFCEYRTFYGRAPEPAATRHFVARRLEEPATRFFLARTGSEAAGFVHLLPSFNTLALAKAWILEDLFVDPRFRRRGIASALLERAEAFARGTGASHISLSTAHTNHAAARIYLAHGYVPDETFRTYHRTLTSEGCP